jgi:alcohol dehydrogenase (cytochrome c)
MKKLILLATLFVIGSVTGSTQTTEELVGDGKNPDNVTTQSMGYDRKSYSPLKQINRGNVKKLVPIWSSSLMNESGELAAPTVYNGVMYVINGKWTFAIDVETGRQIGAGRWISKKGHRVPRSRGARRRSTTARCFA